MLWYILIALFTVLIYFLFAPFYLEIDSGKKLFRFRYHRIASATLTIVDNSIYILLKIIFWKKRFDLFKTKSAKKRTDVIVHERKRSRSIPFRKIMLVIKTFRVKKLLLSLDTENVQVNGILFPLFWAWRTSSGRDVSINFMGENKFILQIKNNAARIVWAFIKS